MAPDEVPLRRQRERCQEHRRRAEVGDERADGGYARGVLQRGADEDGARAVAHRGEQGEHDAFRHAYLDGRRAACLPVPLSPRVRAPPPAAVHHQERAGEDERDAHVHEDARTLTEQHYRHDDAVRHGEGLDGNGARRADGRDAPVVAVAPDAEVDDARRGEQQVAVQRDLVEVEYLPGEDDRHEAERHAEQHGDERALRRRRSRVGEAPPHEDGVDAERERRGEREERAEYHVAHPLTHLSHRIAAA